MLVTSKVFLNRTQQARSRQPSRHLDVVELGHAVHLDGSLPFFSQQPLDDIEENPGPDSGCDAQNITATDVQLLQQRQVSFFRSLKTTVRFEIWIFRKISAVHVVAANIAALKKAA